ncbi:unnamed protein product [Adineta steineri]|uniref:Uncharacterized protein n=1 Tax=Adineta steineri TaxID=433720 RepID=A0A818IYE2_9BILA|nr:unnamed protein product [Adineta steineri]CAF1004705.1 unnamed protein product [Adineta steineri]CAF3533336.1 unnamed protein product [Adineta steineri]
MTYEPLNRRLAILATVFTFLSIILGTIALATNYWTVGPNFEPTFNNGTGMIPEQRHGYKWNGLFQVCRTDEICVARFWPVTFVICVLGLLSLLIGGIFSALDITKATNRRFITPLLIYVGCVLMTAGLFDYASMLLLNSHSSRSMIAALVFAYTALPLSAFVAGRYSAYEHASLVNNGVHLTTQKYAATNGNGL